jgi:hypothetical protein
MDDDHVRAALRRDSEMLLELAPSPDAASLWHEVRRARARRLKRITDICGWSVRAAAAAAGLGVAVSAPDALGVLAGPLLLVAWLSTGICTPVAGGRPSSRRKPGPPDEKPRRVSPRPRLSPG